MIYAVCLISLCQTPYSDSYTRILEESKIPITKKGIEEYLNSLHPNSETAKHIELLIRQLGDIEFFKREEATYELLKLLNSITLLEEATNNEDPEIRWRAKQILKIIKQKSLQTLYAAFIVIEQNHICGLTESIMATIPLCKTTYLETKASDALIKTASEQDAGLLRTIISGKHRLITDDETTRAIAMIVLENIHGKKCDDILNIIQESESEYLQVFAIKSKINHNNRDSLIDLCKLLSSDDLRVRVQSIKILRSISPKRFGYYPYNKSDNEKSIKLWEDWVNSEGQTSDFKLYNNNFIFNRILLTNYTDREVIELDENKNIIWRSNINGVWGCQGLSNGNRLIASYTGKFLIEFDINGKEIWRFEDLPDKPYNMQRLNNGNTLVSCYNCKLLEISQEKDIVWELELPERVKFAQMLDSGDILVALYDSGKVAEIDRDGNIIWEVKGVDRPYSVQRLPNGNTLLAGRTENRVVEIDRNGDVVWSYKSEPSLYSAQRLDNGNTLIVNSGEAIEVDNVGNKVWSYKKNGLRGANYY